MNCQQRLCVTKCRTKKLKLKKFNRFQGNNTFEGFDRNEFDKKAIMPRISFLNETKCKSCGRCQKTFYCDSFLDRNNIHIPPKIDSRNCNGCGLCVQVCEAGALHLYQPDEFVILISDSEERKDILKRLNIPFLTFSPVNDVDNIKVLEEENKVDLIKTFLEKDIINNSETDEIKNLIDEIWECRKEDKHILSEDSSLYPDKRFEEDRYDKCKETYEKLLDIRLKDNQKVHHNNAKVRAAIWSQLIWSDPGQVLWDSYIFTVQSRIEKYENNSWEIVEEDNIENVPQETKLRISSFVVLLCQGEIKVENEFSSPIFTLKKFECDNSTFKTYINSKFGEGRLGIDARTSGNFLLDKIFKNPDDTEYYGFNEISIEKLYSFAGLPWNEMKGEILKSSDSFNKVLTAVSKREY